MIRRLLLLAALLPTGCDQTDQIAGTVKVDQSLTSANGDPWKDVKALACKPASLNICNPAGCKSSAPVTSIRWEPKGQYQRCYSKGCESYTPEVSYSGDWTNITLPKNGMLMRVDSAGRYVEIATLMDTVFIYHGQCTKHEAQ